MSKLWLNQKQERLSKKLDLDAHIQRLHSLFARDKSVVLIGDIRQHIKYIQALEGVELIQMPDLPNMDDLINRLSKNATLTLEQLYLFVEQIEFFNRLRVQELPHIWIKLLASIEVPDEIIKTISFFNEQGLIDSQKEPRLFEIESALNRVKQEQKDKLASVLKSSNLQEYLVDSSIHLYYGQETLLVRGGFSRAIKANVVGRSSGGFFYIVPQSLEDIKRRVSQLLDAQQEIYQEYAKEFSAIYAKWWRFLKFLNREFDRVDHYFARAKMLSGSELHLMLPNNSKEIILKDFAHPAIADAVPIDIEFKKKIMLVTGVNAGGKTMLLKSILSSLFMSKYMIPFKCNSFKSSIGSFENIEVVLDDPQSVKNDISTFAGRIVEFKNLFKLKDAIVGVDEIELGTDADEAAALFRVLLEELSKRGIYFIVTTHHKKLASLMASRRDVELIAALFDEELQKPTYRYLSGTIGKSYAFETARRYGIDDVIINRAKDALGEDKERISDLIERSTQLEIQMRQSLEEAKQKVFEVEERKKRLEHKKELLENEYKSRLFKLEQEYSAALKKLQTALKKAENPEARRLINEAYKIKNRHKESKKPQQIVELKVGDSVKYRDKRATIISLKSKEAMIEVDGMKIRVPRDKLKVVQEIKPPKKPKPKVHVTINRSSSAKMVLKLLGYRAEEAIEETQNFLSNALLHGFDEVEIIHGSGSGVLSKVVTNLLKNHPKVKSFSRVPGNLGATIVKL